MAVSLRPINIDDKNIIYDWVSNAELRKMIGTRTAPTVESHNIWFDKKLKDTENITCIILADDKPVGLIGTNHVEKGSMNANIYIYIGDEGNRGAGIGKKSMNMFTELLFCKYKIHKITANVFEYNHSSKKLFEKCGFSLEGIQKEQVFFDERYYDMILYGLINPYKT